MSLNYTFYLGKGSAVLDHRALKIFNVSAVPRVTLYDQNLPGTDETVTVELPENIQVQVVLEDYAKGGKLGAPQVVNLSTDVAGILFRSGPLRVIGVEETSSSSSLSSSSLSSSSSVSSSSSRSSLSSLSSLSSSSSSATSLSSLSSTSSGTSQSSLSSSSPSSSSPSSLSSSSSSSSSSVSSLSSSSSSSSS